VRRRMKQQTSKRIPHPRSWRNKIPTIAPNLGQTILEINPEYTQSANSYEKMAITFTQRSPRPARSPRIVIANETGSASGCVRLQLSLDELFLDLRLRPSHVNSSLLDLTSFLEPDSGNHTGCLVGVGTCSDLFLSSVVQVSES
jgi:hypothetical protein